MNYVIVGLIVVLLLAGATALVLGRQGINRTTLVFAWLVLVASGGFIYLAGRVGERERVWREKIRTTTEEINTAIYGKFAGKKFLLQISPALTSQMKQPKPDVRFFYSEVQSALPKPSAAMLM
ncbi:MAG: hypothetical protein KAT44_01040 [Pirellulales bacterium]|nr:hypothetical protein [Pirellulales bacterium]